MRRCMGYMVRDAKDKDQAQVIDKEELLSRILGLDESEAQSQDERKLWLRGTRSLIGWRCDMVSIKS